MAAEPGRGRPGGAGLQGRGWRPRFLDAARQQLNSPVVLVWDNLNTHVSRTMRELIAAPDWLTVFQLAVYVGKPSRSCGTGEAGEREDED